MKRFENKIFYSPCGCWLWIGAIGTTGYGQFWYHKRETASRVAYMLYKGPIQKGMSVCHTCDNPICVNPDHLFLGRQIENMRDMVIKGRSNKLRGERHGSAKITATQVDFIRGNRGKITQIEIAKTVGITQAQVSKIQLKQKWK